MKENFAFIAVIFICIFLAAWSLQKDKSSNIVFAVQGDSMFPTLKDGDLIIVDTNGLVVRESLVILIGKSKKRSIVKKIVSVGGDLIELKKDSMTEKYHLYVNKILYKKADGSPFLISESKMKVLENNIRFYNNKIPPNSFLVLGESSKSIDSREFGFVGQEDILGIVNNKLSF
jgi:signal peptidase I